MPPQPPTDTSAAAPHDAVAQCVERLSSILARCMADADRIARESRSSLPSLSGTPWKSWDALHQCVIELARSLLTIGLNAEECHDAIARVIGAAVPDASRRAEIDNGLRQWVDEAMMNRIC